MFMALRKRTFDFHFNRIILLLICSSSCIILSVDGNKNSPKNDVLSRRSSSGSIARLRIPPRVERRFAPRSLPNPHRPNANPTKDSKEAQKSTVGPFVMNVMRTTVKAMSSERLNLLNDIGRIRKSKSMLYVPHEANRKRLLNERNNKLKRLRYNSQHKKPVRLVSHEVYEAELVRNIEEDELRYLGNRQNHASSRHANENRKLQSGIRDDSSRSNFVTAGVRLLNRPSNVKIVQRHQSPQSANSKKQNFVSTAVKKQPIGRDLQPQSKYTHNHGTYISFHSPNQISQQPPNSSPYHSSLPSWMISDDRDLFDGTIFDAAQNPKLTGRRALSIDTPDSQQKTNGMIAERLESSFQQQSNSGEVVTSSKKQSGHSEGTEDRSDRLEHFGTIESTQTIVPPSDIAEPNLDEFGDNMDSINMNKNSIDQSVRNEHSNNHPYNQKTLENYEVINSLPSFPFSHCYMNVNGFMCCNRSLELTMRQTYTDLLRTTPAYNPCNIQRLANLIQKNVENRFEIPFEIIVSLDDFVLYSHFISDLTCKIELDGHYIAAYAASSRAVRKEQKQNGASAEVRPILNSNILTEFAHNIRDRYLYNKTDETVNTVNTESQEEDQLDSEPLVITIDQPIPRISEESSEPVSSDQINENSSIQDRSLLITGLLTNSVGERQNSPVPTAKSNQQMTAKGLPSVNSSESLNAAAFELLRTMLTHKLASSDSFQNSLFPLITTSPTPIQVKFTTESTNDFARRVYGASTQQQRGSQIINSVVPLNITGYHDASSTATDRIHVSNQKTLEPMPASAFSPISSSNPPNIDDAVTPTSTHSTTSDSLSVTWPTTPQLTVFQNRRPAVRNRPSLSHRRKNIHNLRQMIRKDALKSAQSSNSDSIDAVRVHKVSEAFVRKMPSTNVPSANGNAVTDSSSAPDSIEIAGWEHLVENGIILAPNSSEIESTARSRTFSDRRASLNYDEVQDITDLGFLGD